MLFSFLFFSFLFFSFPFSFFAHIFHFDQKHQENIEFLKKVSESYGFKFELISLEDAFDVALNENTEFHKELVEILDPEKKRRFDGKRE